MKKIKRISALMCVLVICFTIATPSAHAAGLLGGQQFGAWIAAALTSINIVGQTILPAPGPVDPYFKWLSMPASQTQTDYQYPVQSSIITDYMNASTIKVSQGVTTIDGVVYDELWIEPGTFTNGLKTNLFDFKTKWALLSGQTGTLATGIGSVDGVPIYQVGTGKRSVTYNLNGKTGSWKISDNIYIVKNAKVSGRMQNADGSRYKVFAADYGDTNQFYIEVSNDKPYGKINTPEDITGYQRELTWVVYDNTPFQYDYTSGVVPAEEAEIPSDYGLSIQIPHDQLQTFYNTYPQYNVDNTVINIQEEEIDIDELTQAIFDMITSMEDIKATWTDGEEPEPPAPVDPIENIDENVQSINDYQQNMDQQVNHMHQDVEAIHQTQQQQQQTQQDIKETSESIDSTLKDVKDVIQPGEITPKKFDLRRLFPFCIPFDIYNMLQKFDAQPQAPHVQLPFVIESIGFSYTIDLDFSAFDGLAAAMRTVELIVYCLGLAWATSKVIKW